MSTTNGAERRLKIGSILFIIVGLFPFLLGVRNFILFIYSVNHPDEVWRARNFAPADYTLNDLRNYNPQFATDFVLGEQVEYANLVNSGALVLLIAIFALRRGRKWAWLVLLGIGLWAGLNDLDAMLRAKVFPLALIPDVIGIVGLIITYPVIFGRRPVVAEPSA